MAKQIDPWDLKLERHGGYRLYKIRYVHADGSYRVIGSFRGVAYMADPDEETRAAARLIEAAPDLLAACKALLANPWLASSIESARNPDGSHEEFIPEYAADCAGLRAVADQAQAAILKAEPTP